MNCLTCAHAEMKKYPDHARSGMTHCDLVADVGKFYSLKHSCDDAQPVSAQLAIERRAWDAKDPRKLGRVVK